MTATAYDLTLERTWRADELERLATSLPRT